MAQNYHPSFFALYANNDLSDKQKTTKLTDFKNKLAKADIKNETIEQAIQQAQRDLAQEQEFIKQFDAEAKEQKQREWQLAAQKERELKSAERAKEAASLAEREKIAAELKQREDQQQREIAARKKAAEEEAARKKVADVSDLPKAPSPAPSEASSTQPASPPSSPIIGSIPEAEDSDSDLPKIEALPATSAQKPEPLNQQPAAQPKPARPLPPTPQTEAQKKAAALKKAKAGACETIDNMVKGYEGNREIAGLAKQAKNAIQSDSTKEFGIIQTLEEWTKKIEKAIKGIPPALPPRREKN
jgi:hypothetical protein